MDNGKVAANPKGSMGKGGNTQTMKSGDTAKKSKIEGFGSGKVANCGCETVGRMPGKGSIPGFSGGAIEGKV